MEPDALSMFFIGKGSCSNLRFPCTQSDTNVALTNHYSRPALATIWPPQKKQLSFFFFPLVKAAFPQLALMFLASSLFLSFPSPHFYSTKERRQAHPLSTNIQKNHFVSSPGSWKLLFGREGVCVCDWCSSTIQLNSEALQDNLFPQLMAWLKLF